MPCCVPADNRGSTAPSARRPRRPSTCSTPRRTSMGSGPARSPPRRRGARRSIGGCSASWASCSSCERTSVCRPRRVSRRAGAATATSAWRQGEKDCVGVRFVMDTPRDADRAGRRPAPLGGGARRCHRHHLGRRTGDAHVLCLGHVSRNKTPDSGVLFLETWLDVQDDGHRAVVDELDLHVGAEAAGGDGGAEALERGDDGRRPGARRPRGARPRSMTGAGPASCRRRG